MKYNHIVNLGVDVFEVKEKADLIYIDPPFGTQQNYSFSKGSDLSFEDTWSSKEEYVEWLHNVFRHLWDNCLKPNGIIYSHNNFDTNALLYAALGSTIRKKLISTIYWNRSHPKNNISRGWGNTADTLLMFAKGKDYFFQVEYGEPSDITKGTYSYTDNIGVYALVPITGERNRIGHRFEYNSINPKFGWRYNKSIIEELDSKNGIHFSNKPYDEKNNRNKPYKKKYLKDSKGPPVMNIWNDIHNITRIEDDKRVYPTQKPTKLLKRIIQSSCPPSGTILDPFCGSFVTIKAAQELDNDYRTFSFDKSIALEKILATRIPYVDLVKTLDKR